ncbi:MAG: hypothetical protein WC916_04300 [Candidatus Woesearchaeota archaeon]
MSTFNPADVEEEKLAMLNRNNFIHRRTHGRSKPSLSKKEVDTICRYLENPTKIGIWTLNGKWHRFGGVSKSVIRQLEKESKKESIDIQEGRRKLKIKIQKDFIANLKYNTKRFTFLFNLFMFLVHLEKQDISFLNYLEGSDDKLTFDIIDLEEIKKEYLDAFEYFKNNIYFEGFSPTVKAHDLVRIKEGVFILNKFATDEQEYVSMVRRGETANEIFPPSTEIEDIGLISIDLESLEKLKIFYEKLGKLSDASIRPIFSPEEEVFGPYFSFLQETYLYFIDNENIKSHFRKSISEYNDRDYSHCIGTVGLILEDYLIQVYETFFRDICPKGLTMGELFNLIQSKINDTFKQVPEPIPEIKPIYDSITSLTQTTDSLVYNKELLGILREILNYIKKDKKFIIDLIDVNKNKENTCSVFPNQLTYNIREAIKNRNAISHRSTVPIGRYEALRTVYCCMTLIIWWDNEKRIINWTLDKKEILKQTIERNSFTTLS